jgi:hypothetical protein
MGELRIAKIDIAFLSWTITATIVGASLCNIAAEGGTICDTTFSTYFNFHNNCIFEEYSGANEREREADETENPSRQRGGADPSKFCSPLRTILQHPK